MEGMAISAVRPWFSIDAAMGTDILYHDTAEQISYCLDHCPYKECINCIGGGTCAKGGRPKGKTYARRKKGDYESLKEMLSLNKTDAEICVALSVSARTLRNYKKQLRSEGMCI